MAPRAAERRAWWGAFGLLLLACAAWSLVVPPLTGPDEWSHANRSVAVVRGELTGAPSPPPFRNALVSVHVPESILVAGEAAECFIGEPRAGWVTVEMGFDIATCPEYSGGSRLVSGTTTEHRGQPLYYLLTGLPSLAFPSVFGTYLMRLVGAALCSALLASAFTSLLRLRGNRLVVLGGAAALTPAVLYLGGTINSAGLEMAATLALVASGAALVRAPGEPDRRLVDRTGVALVALVLARGLSPGYAVGALVALALVARAGRLRTLAGRLDVRLWGAAAAAATVVSGVWLVWVHHRFSLPARQGTGLAHAVRELPWDLRDLVAMFGVTDVMPPYVLHLTWAAAALAVAAASWRAGARRELLVGGLLVVGGVAVLVSGEGLSIPDSGFWWQGRYVLPPVISGLVILALGPREPRPAGGGAPVDAGRRLGPPLLAVLVLLHAWAFLYAVRHYTVGFEGPANPASFLTDTLWAPPLAPAAVWVAVYVAALASGAALLWRAASAPRPLGTGADGDLAGTGVPDGTGEPAGAGGAAGRDADDREEPVALAGGA